MRTTTKWLSVLLGAVLGSCSSSGPGPATFTVGGTVTGLVGSGLVLQNNGGNDLAIATNGTFVFSAPVTTGSPYAVRVAAQPSGPAQACTVTNGSGTMGSSNVTGVSITCSTVSHTIGGLVTGLVGSGLVLQNNAGDNLPVSANGSFTFVTPVPSGGGYAVTVLAQPTSPSQVCTVTNGVGNVGGSNVSSVVVDCTSRAFTVGGTVSGLAGSGLVLRNNGGDNLAVSGNGSFTFATPVASGGAYAVTVLTQPTSPSQTCTVTNGSGVVGGEAITGVTIACLTNSYTVGGSVIGLQGAGLVLSTPGQVNLTVPSGATTFTFPAPVPSGTTYAIAVVAQPSSPPQSCTVGGATGTVAGANVTSVVVNCTTSRFLVGGTVSGLTGTGLVLSTSGQPDLTILPNATSFAFGNTAAPGSAYAVTVKTQPTAPSQTCSVVNGVGTVGSANVTSIAVTCVTNTYTVGGTVSGLTGTGLVLSTSGQADLVVPAGATTFTFAAPAASGSAYAVAVKTQPNSPPQTCGVSNGGGTVGGANVNGIAVTCVTNTYSVGGTVSGLVGAGLVLVDNGADDLAVSANGAFTFGTKVVSGGSFVVTVKTQPTSPSQTCTVTNGSGSVGSGNVTNVGVTCATQFTVGGTVAGLVGAGLVLSNNGTNDLSVAASGVFTFSAPVPSGGQYAVAVRTQPSFPSQACTVTNGSGTVENANVANVAVDCPAPPPVMQHWSTPSAWGGDANGVWPNDSPNMIQHLIFNASGPLETKLGSGAWTAAPTAPAITSTTAIANPIQTRYGAGPFVSGPVPLHYSWSGDSSVLNLPRDLLVCAVVKPDWDPLGIYDVERILIAKGKQDVSGWVLMQMHGAFCFHYQTSPGAGNWVMTDTATYYTNFGIRDEGPLNTSYAVVCAGRDDARGQVVIAANSYEPSVKFMGVPSTPLVTDATPASVGGYDDGDARFVFKGKIYETAVWNEPATAENIQAKMAQALGLTLPGGGIANYVHNREAPFTGLDGLYRTAWRHAPRIYPGKGFLFGLQGTNKVAYPQALDRWTANGAGVTVTANAILPPNDSDIPSASHLVLPPGTGISLPLASFAKPGRVEGQVWIRPVSAGTLRVRSDVAAVPGPGRISMGQQDVVLGTPAQWSRVPIVNITSDGSQLPGGEATVYLENPSGAPASIDLYAWGVALMQVGRGADIGFDPGFTMYDTLKDSDDAEALVLPAVPDSTAVTGFCLHAEAAPFEGMAWSAPFELKRVAVSWTGLTAPQNVELYADAANICFRVRESATSVHDTCGALPVSWATASSHKFKACLAPGGQATVYGDGTVLNTGVHAFVPDLQGGSVHVGEGDSGTWQGYISAAKVCRNTGVPSDCN
jgi:hypothetical protein